MGASAAVCSGFWCCNATLIFFLEISRCVVLRGSRWSFRVLVCIHGCEKSSVVYSWYGLVLLFYEDRHYPDSIYFAG